MTELMHDVDAPSDAELISRVRGGDVAAYGDLFSRHVDAARRLARQLVRGPDADDLVSDAFAKVLGVLQGGGGPDVAFRAYLLTAVRRLHVDKIRAGAKLQTSDDMEAFDAGIPFQDTAVAAFESGAAAKAFASLPERWQLVLWHLEVEGQKPADIAPLLGMSANSVSALAYRAREGLRQAFLTMHLNDTSDTSCRWVNEHLGAYVRNGLAKRDAAKVQGHLDECRRCTAMYLELTEVNSNLRGIIAPLLLGAAAAGYLSSTGAAAGGGFSLVSMVGRVRDAVSANAGAATAGAVAAGVAAVATAGIMLLPSSGPDDTVTGADEPIGTVTTPGAPDGEPGPGEETAGPDGTAREDDGTAPSEEPALGTTPDAVPVGDAGTESTEDGGTGSETDGSTGGDSPGGEIDPNQPPGEQPPGEQPPGEQPPGEEPPAEQPPGEQPPGEEPPGEQPPGEQPPGEQPPGETPPGDDPVTYTLQVTALRVEDGQVSFDFEGVLPPVVYLSIESGPASVLFTDGGTCEVEAGGLTATCTITDTQTLLAPLARIAAAVSEEPFISDASVGLTTPLKDGTVTIAMAASPGGTALDKETFEVKAPVAPTADVSLDLPATITATEALDYTISPVTITGVPSDYTGPFRFRMTSVPPSEAVFVRDELESCEVRDDGSTLVCSDVPTSFTVRVKNNNDPTTVSITLDPLVGLIDPNPTDNTDQATLEAFRGEVDLKVSADPSLDGNAGKGTIGVNVADAPADRVMVTATFDTRDIMMTAWSGDCTETIGLVTCTVTGPQVPTLDFGVELVERPANETRVVTFRAEALGYTETNDEDNTVVVLVERTLGGSSGGGSLKQLSAGGLQPSATGSPVVETIEKAAETFTRIATSVTAAEKQPAKHRTSSTTSLVTKPAKTVADTAERKVNQKPSGTKATSRASDTDRREAVRDERHSRAETSDKKSPAGAVGSQKESPDTAPTADTTSDDGGLVDTIVTAVKKVV